MDNLLTADELTPDELADELALRYHPRTMHHGAAAAVELLCTYADGYLLRQPRIRDFLRVAAGSTSLAFHELADAAHTAEARPDDPAGLGLDRAANAAVLIACALAAGTPLTGLPRLLRRFDAGNARRVLRAVYVALGGLDDDTGRTWPLYAALGPCPPRRPRTTDLAEAIQNTSATSWTVTDPQTAIPMATAATTLSAMLVGPGWSTPPGLRCGPAGYSWLWQGPDHGCVRIDLHPCGTLWVHVGTPASSATLTPNGSGSYAQPARQLNPEDLTRLHDLFTLHGVPVGQRP